MRRFLRHRLLLLWMVLAVAACAVALVFFRLYATARDEIDARSAAAVAQEKARAVAMKLSLPGPLQRAWSLLLSRLRHFPQT